MTFETEISIYTKRVCSRKSPYNNFACAPTRQVSKPCVFLTKYHSCTWSECFIYTYWIWKNGKFPIPTSNTPQFAQVGTHRHFSPWWIYQVLVWTWYIPKWRNGMFFCSLNPQNRPSWLDMSYATRRPYSLCRHDVWPRDNQNPNHGQQTAHILVPKVYPLCSKFHSLRCIFRK